MGEDAHKDGTRWKDGNTDCEGDLGGGKRTWSRERADIGKERHAHRQTEMAKQKHKGKAYNPLSTNQKEQSPPSVCVSVVYLFNG